MVIESVFFKENRQRLSSRIPDNSVVFIFSGAPSKISGDTDARFLPDRNFYYLTGISAQGFILLISKIEGEIREKIYIEDPKDRLKARWNGKRLSFDEVSKAGAFAPEDIEINNAFESESYKLIKEHELGVFMDGSSIMEAPRIFRESLSAITDDVTDIADILTSMRLIKDQREVNAIREAARLTEEAIADTKKIIKPGISEYDIYIKLEYELARRGVLIPAFETIVSVGDNAFYLHHSVPEADRTVAPGCQIQIDVGARAAGYCGDISRVFFVGGEKDLRYELLGLIRKLRHTAFDIIKPGETFASLNKAMYDIAGDFLVEHKILPENHTEEDVRRYYWHNIGHQLGLDVHDVGDRNKPLEAGNCIAVEPGVYIPEWGTGFRIEDDVLVTADGCELLSSGTDDPEDIIIDV